MTYRFENEYYQCALTTRFTTQPLGNTSNASIQSTGYAHYRPLQKDNGQIRLLYLLPSKISADHNGQVVMCCKILTHTKETAPRYTALSYTWADETGDATKCKPLCIDNQIVLITANLSAALEHLQHPDETLVLWVDALCINQDDNDEKSYQVHKMTNIYAAASLVIAWLGLGSSETQQDLQEISRYFSMDRDYFRSLTVQQLSRIFTVEPMNTLLARSWFKRVWIFQEAVVNVNTFFVCGHSSCSKYEMMVASLRWIDAGARLGLPTSKTYILRVTPTDLQPMTLEEFVTQEFDLNFDSGESLQASDHKDYVFSYYGLITNLESHGLKVDYSQSVVQIYTDFSASCIKMGKAELIGACWRPGVGNKNLPSWVPDFSCTRMRRNTSFVNGEGFAFKILGEDCRVLMGRTPSLQIQSFCLGHIDQLSTSFEDSDSISTRMRSAQQFLSAVESAVIQCNENLNLGVHDLPVGVDLFPLAHTPRFTKNLSSDRLYAAFDSLMREHMASEHDQETVSHKSGTNEYVEQLRLQGLHHLFHMSNGLVGLSEVTVSPGDVVVCLSHIHRQWVLREVQPDTFHLISSAIVYPITWHESNMKDLRTIYIV